MASLIMSEPEKYTWTRNQLRMVDASLQYLLITLKALRLISDESFYNGVNCDTNLLCREEEEE